MEPKSPIEHFLYYEPVKTHLKNVTDKSGQGQKGSNDREPAQLHLLLQLPTEEPARVQAGGSPLPQNGV